MRTLYKISEDFFHPYQNFKNEQSLLVNTKDKSFKKDV